MTSHDFLPSTLLLASCAIWSGWTSWCNAPLGEGVVWVCVRGGGGGGGREGRNALLMDHTSPSLFQLAGWSLPFWGCHMCVVVICCLRSYFCVSASEAARIGFARIGRANSLYPPDMDPALSSPSPAGFAMSSFVALSLHDSHASPPSPSRAPALPPTHYQRPLH